MIRFKKRIYQYSPVPIQNLWVSLYGWQLSRRRYGPEHERFLSNLSQTKNLSAEEIQKLQINQLRKLLKVAFKDVPHYADWAQKTGFRPEDIRQISDLCALPILNKSDVRENLESLTNRTYPRKSLFSLNTSGTSGSPLVIRCDAHSRQRHYALWTRLREENGLLRNDHRATFFGQIIHLADANQPPFWRYDASQHNLLCSSYHLAPQNLPYYAKKLEKYQPQEIIGYPSSLHALALHLLENPRHTICPKVVFTTAEMLLPQQRTAIEAAFKAPLIDQYGCTEMVLFVAQCREGSYHLHPEEGILEVLDEKGKPSEEGEAVCTGLLNLAMPLIRYRLGDKVRLASKNCSCGSSFPVIAEILGRNDDILKTPDGRPIGRLDPVFKGLPGIRETQIVQESENTLHLYLVPDVNFSDTVKTELLNELIQRVGSNMEILITEVNAIPREANGKFRAVISKLSK